MGSPLKICWLVPDDYMGGVFPVGLEACRHAQLAGHDARMLLVCEPLGNYSPSSGVSIHSLRLLPDAPDAPQVILDWIVAGKFDLVVINCCGEADPIVPHLPESMRCIYVIHNSPRRHWLTAVRQQHCIDRMVAVSEYVAAIVRPRLKTPEKLGTIHNGSLYPAPPEENSSRPDDLIFMGGQESRKGADDALRIWPELIRQGFKGRLHWCGSITDKFRRKLNSLPARDQLEIHGRVPRTEIFELAARSKVLLMLSRAEAFGMVTIEAMSMGCVPVAWNVNSGTTEIAEPGVHGFYATLGDDAQLVRTIMDTCAKHSALLHPVVRRARQDFSVECMWSAYERAFVETMQTPRLRRPLAGKPTPRFRPPLRPTNLMPASVSNFLKQTVDQSPKLARMLASFRR